MSQLSKEIIEHLGRWLTKFVIFSSNNSKGFWKIGKCDNLHNSSFFGSSTLSSQIQSSFFATSTEISKTFHDPNHTSITKEGILNGKIGFGRTMLTETKTKMHE